MTSVIDMWVLRFAQERVFSFTIDQQLCRRAIVSGPHESRKKHCSPKVFWRTSFVLQVTYGGLGMQAIRRLPCWSLFEVQKDQTKSEKRSATKRVWPDLDQRAEWTWSPERRKVGKERLDKRCNKRRQQDVESPLTNVCTDARRSYFCEIYWTYTQSKTRSDTDDEPAPVNDY